MHFLRHIILINFYRNLLKTCRLPKIAINFLYLSFANKVKKKKKLLSFAHLAEDKLSPSQNMYYIFFR